MKRRDFLARGAMTAGALGSLQLLTRSAHGAKKLKRPNIIFILTDQQSSGMMSCAGNPWLKTPAMDYIAENGVRFTRAYPTNPVCSPARVSLMTGRFPGSFNDKNGNPARENRGSMRIPAVSDEVKNTTIAAHMLKAGYDLVYGGKEHLPKPLIPSRLGFNDITNNERNKLAGTAAGYIQEKHDRPYFMWLNFINPHDICYMAIRDFAQSDHAKRLAKNGKQEIVALDKALKIPDGISQEKFFAEYCPPLPPNFEPQKDEPAAIGKLLDQRRFRRSARQEYTEEQWRMHRWAYARLTEMVDARIQVVLDALKESGQEENTLVIFSSDHGDMDASHRMEHKTVMYEESANVPFLAMWKGQIPAGRIDDKHLVSNGLDLLPTICEYAGIEGRADPRGRSLRALFEGGEVKWRDTLGMESQIGRMVVDNEGYKYIRYDATEPDEEQLLDLNKKPLESKHFTDAPAYAAKLAKLRAAYEKLWFPDV